MNQARSLAGAGLALFVAHTMTAIAAAQPCENVVNCDPVNANQVKYVCPHGGHCYDPSDTPGLTPDRRPVYWFNLFGRDRTCFDFPNMNTPNPKGHGIPWRDADWTTLESQLDDAWNAGFRRIILNRPGGQAQNNFVPMAMYEHLTDAQKDLLQNDLDPWITAKRIADPKFEFGIFIGSLQSGSPCTPCVNENQPTPEGAWDCTDDDDDHNFTYNTRCFDPTVKASMQELYQTVKPFLNISCNAAWFDKSSPIPDRLVDLLQSPDYASVKIGGEAIPRTSLPDNDVDLTYAENAAWFGRWTYIFAHGWQSGGTNPQTVNPANTELGVLFQNPAGNRSYTIEDVGNIRDQGFVTWGDTTGAGFVQRMHDGDDDEFYDGLAANGCIADFDFDGDVDMDDLDLFDERWDINDGRTDPSFAVWDGDIDNDDSVDEADSVRFLFLWAAGCS